MVENENMTPEEEVEETVSEEEFDLSEFETEVEEPEELIAFSEDEAKYANGFPDWDLVPPKKK